MKKITLFLFVTFAFVLTTSTYATTGTTSFASSLLYNNDLGTSFTKLSKSATLFNPPMNDDCSTAIPLTVGYQFSDSAIIGTNITATNSGVTSPGCANYQGQDVWYSILVPASGILTLEVRTQTGGITDTGGAAYSGTCGALTILGCSDDDSPAGAHPIININDITLANQTVYFRVWEYGGDENGEFLVSAYTTLANDDCANAEPLTLGTVVTGDTTGASDSGFADGSCGSTGGNQDIWYSFVAPATGNVSLDTDADTVVIYNGCAGIEVGCGTNSSTIMGLSPSAIYYVRVYNSGIARVAGVIELTISEATLSTEDFDNSSIFSFYPNPVKNTLTLNAKKEIANVSVFNMLGQTVIRSLPNVVSNEIDMSNLQAGAYFVQVTVGNTVETVKVIKK